MLPFLLKQAVQVKRFPHFLFSLLGVIGMINCFAEETAESSSDVQYMITRLVSMFRNSVNLFIAKWHADKRIGPELLAVENEKTSTHPCINIDMCTFDGRY